MATKSKTTAKRKRAPAKRKTPKKATPRTRGVLATECRLEELPPAAAEVAERIEREGGLVIASYYEPLGRNPLLLAALPIDRVEPTPFQRDLSDAHHKKLSGVIDRTGLFLDPVIAITAPKQGFWTPNGRHRLEAMRRWAPSPSSRWWCRSGRSPGRFSRSTPRRRTTCARSRWR